MPHRSHEKSPAAYLAPRVCQLRSTEPQLSSSSRSSAHVYPYLLVASVLTTLEAFLGIALTGLLGLVLGTSPAAGRFRQTDDRLGKQ